MSGIESQGESYMNEFEALHSEAMRTQNEIIDQTIRNMKISPEEKDILKDFLDSQDINERPRLLYRIVNEVKKGNSIEATIQSIKKHRTPDGAQTQRDDMIRYGVHPGGARPPRHATVVDGENVDNERHRSRGGELRQRLGRAQAIRNMKISPEEDDALRSFLNSQNKNDRPGLFRRIMNEVQKGNSMVHIIQSITDEISEGDDVHGESNETPLINDVTPVDKGGKTHCMDNDIEEVDQYTYQKLAFYTDFAGLEGDDLQCAMDNGNLSSLFLRYFDNEGNYIEETTDGINDGIISIVLSKSFFDEIQKNGYNVSSLPISRNLFEYINLYEGNLSSAKSNEQILNEGKINLNELNPDLKKDILGNIKYKYLDDILNKLFSDEWYYEDFPSNENDLLKVLNNKLSKDTEFKNILKSYSENFHNGEDYISILSNLLLAVGHVEIDTKLINVNVFENLNISDNIAKNRELHTYFKQRNLARNQQVTGKSISVDESHQTDNRYINLQKASGADIARSAGLGEQLGEYNMNDNFEVSDENKKIIQQEAFPIAWHNFISNNTDISEYLTDMDMMRIYDFENNSINKALREGDESRGIEGLSQKLKNDFGDEIDVDEIYNRLQGFINEMNSTVNELEENYISEKGIIYNDSKIDAIGGVIDSIKSIFDKLGEDFKLGQLCEGFKYDEEKPVKIEKINGKDMLVIRGSINLTKTKVCYDLKDGDLYMNSFVKETTNPATITVGDRRDSGDIYPQADVKIGSIDSFEEILSDIDISTEFENIDNDYNHHVGGYENQVKEDHNFNNPVNKPTEVGNNEKKPRGGGFWGKVMGRRGSKLGETGQRMDPGYFRPQPPLQRQGPQLPDNLGETYQNNIETNKLIFQNKINTTVDLIGDQVKKYSEIQAQKNDIVTNFLKTFNIMQEDGTQKDGSIKSMEFHQDSDIYKVLHIINNYKANELSQLSEFSNFMGEICKYGGLVWGKSNIMEQQTNKMYKEVSEADENNKNSARGCLKQSLSNLRNESLALSQSDNLSFRSDRPLGMAKLIVDNVLNTSPNNIANARFDKMKMDNFLKSLTSGKEVNKDIEDNPDKILDQLNNI